ncbi:MAG: Uma2 family endonuclease [Planctomycetota bacterium]
MTDPMVSFISRTRLSQSDFEEWTRQTAVSPYRSELIRGHVVMEPPAGYRHGRTTVRMVHALRSFVEARDLGEVLESSTGFHLPTGDTLAPDITFISHERLAGVPDQDPERFLRAVPDLVVEVLSESTRQRDMKTKRAIYQASGVREYWLVDPRAQVITLVLFESGTEQTFAAGDVVRSSVLAGLEIAVVDMFR